MAGIKGWRPPHREHGNGRWCVYPAPQVNGLTVSTQSSETSTTQTSIHEVLLIQIAALVITFSAPTLRPFLPYQMPMMYHTSGQGLEVQFQSSV